MNIELSKIALNMTSEALLVIGILLNIFCILFYGENIKPRTSNLISVILISAAMFSALLTPSIANSLIYICAFVCMVFAIKFTKRLTHKVYYFNALLFALTLGSTFLAASSDFLTMFISLEVTSVAACFLAALFMSKNAVRSSVKYFIQSVVASCFLLLAISYLYGIFGSINFNYIAQNAPYISDIGLLPIAGAILFCALSFKVLAVPFCSWAAETFESTDYGTGLALATIPQIAGIVLFARLAFVLCPPGSVLQLILIIMAIFTLIFASLLALRQTKIKRFLAYSSIAHSGYLIFAAAIVGPLSLVSVKFYLISYLIATIGVWAGFGIFYLNCIGKETGGKLEDLRSIAYQNPYYATMMTLCLLSLAGMPPMLGFFSRFYLFTQVLSAGVWVTIPLLVLLFASIVAAFYYMRIITFFFKRGTGIKLSKKTTTARVILTIASLLLIILIFLSEPLIGLCLFT